MSETEAERFVKAVLDSGGSAFPSERAVPGGGTLTMSGMTLRDHFAAHAMQATLSSDTAVAEIMASDMGADRAGLAKSVAEIAYLFADAMLAARTPSPIKEE